MQSHQTSRQDRAYRRDARLRAVAKAFRLIHFTRRQAHDWSRRRWQCALRVVGVDKWRRQRAQQYENEGVARKWADNMRLCSCYMCSGWKKHDKSRWHLRQEARDITDREDLLEFLGK